MKPKHAALVSFLLTGAVSFACMALGTLLCRVMPTFNAVPLHYILLATTVLICIGNRVAAGVFADKHFGMSPEERDAFYDQHRDACDKNPDAVLRRLGDITTLPTALLFLYALFSVGLLLTGTMARQITVFLPMFLLFMPIYNRLLLVRGRLHLEELVPESAMPATHTLARRAAESAGIKGSVRLQIIYDQDVSISCIRGTYVVFIGTRFFSVATEKEMYAAILRQFAYFADPTVERRLTRHYHLSNMGSAKPRVWTWAFDLFYSLADAHMEWYAPLYNMAIARKIAQTAARFMERDGCARADASAAIKQEMWEYFDFEWFIHLPESPYASTKEPVTYEATICDAFRRAMGERYPVWLALSLQKLRQEGFLGLTATEHRTLMGLSDADLPREPVFSDPTTSFGQEELIIRQEPTPERYAAARQTYYLEPLATIREWEASGADRPAYEMSPVLDAYRILHRYNELEALCDRVLAEEADYAHALYLKGECLLQRYEDEGIDCIYRAIDINKNYMREGFEAVSRYCRLMGLREEMNTFRRRSRTIAEAHAAEHEDAGTLRATDRLVKETELDDRLPEMLNYMVTVADGCIDHIYLVRKVISEDFFSSVFVVDFTPGADPHDIDRAYTAIFHYLDAADWQYSLFIYNRETEQAVRRVPGSLVWERRDD